jgi:hypothetical protein
MLHNAPQTKRDRVRGYGRIYQNVCLLWLGYASATSDLARHM